MPQRRAVSLLFAITLLTATCGNDAGTSEPPSSTPRADAATTTVASPPDAAGTTSDGAGPDCATMAEAAAQTQGSDSFPDFPGAEYTVGGAALDDVGRAVVTIAVQGDIGYDDLLFLSDCDTGEVTLLAAYTSAGTGWTLLFTTAATADVPAAIDG